MSGMNTNLLPPQFQFLVNDLGFRPIASEVSPYFDNMFSDVTNDSLNVRVSRDRGFLDAEVSPSFAPDRWIPLGLLRQVALQRDPMENVTLDEQADFLRCQYSIMVEMLSAANLDDTERRVIQLGGERFR